MGCEILDKVKKYVHSCDSGFIYQLRVWHGRINHEFYQVNFCLLRTLVRRKNKVVFSSFDGKNYGDNPRCILERIHKISPDTELIWLLDGIQNHNLPNYVRSVDCSSTWLLIKEMASASILIDNSMYWRQLTPISKQLIIQTWHGGLGFKKICNDEANKSTVPNNKRISKAYDFYISNSTFLTKVFRSAFNYNGKVWRSGYPTEDELYIDREEKKKIREYYHLNSETKIVLYVPTFRDKYQWKPEFDANRITNALRERIGGEWVMLVRWHYFQKDNLVVDNAIDVTDYSNVQDLIKASDATISDYSSTLFYAVQRDIPCFVYANDYENYLKDRDFYYPLEEQPFPLAFDEEELLENIVNYDPAIWKDKWEQYRIRTGHIVTGHSAEDIAKVCVDFLNGKSKKEIMKEIPFETDY